MILRRGVGVALATLVVAAGCAAQRPDAGVTSRPTASAVAPSAGTVTWRSVGFTYGPADVALPPELVLQRRVDQANVATAFFTRPAARDAVAWFRTELPRAGFTVDADSDDALRAHDATWDASLSTGPDGLVGLTFRRHA